MKTKNRKRIGPVPITLVAVFALAAFISVGLLLAPNGVPPAAAQDDADCEVDATTIGTGAVEAVDCPSTDSMATIKFTGDAGAAADENVVTLHLMIRDDSGNLRIYKNGEVDYNSDESRYEITLAGQAAGLGDENEPAPSPLRYRYKGVKVLGAKVVDGDLVKDSVSVMVPGDVTIYSGDVPSGGLRPLILNGPTGDARRELADGVDATVDVTLLGAPSVGTDGNDPGGMVDDVNQCLVGPDDIDDTTTTTISQSSDCQGDDVFYGAESRSKLVVRAHDAVGFDPLTTTIINDGMMKDHIVMNNNDVTVYAVVKDAMDNARTGSDVVFTVSSVPMNAGPNYVRDAEAMEVVASGATSEQVNVTGATASTTIMLDDAVAMRMIRDLSGMSYKVTVKVTIGDLNLGTVVIARAGDLDMVSAEACAVVGMGETDTKMDGCMTDYNPKMIYGPSTDTVPSTFSIYAMAKDSQGTKVIPDSFMVKPATAATWWDALDCPMMNDAVMPMDDEPAVGSDDPMSDPKSPYCAMYAGLSAEAMPVVMRAFGKAYGDATKAFNITATGKTVPIDGMVPLTVKEDAPGAKYLLDVVASTGTGDKLITKSDQVRVIVSGELKEYMVDGPDYIALDGNATYTVTAMDENGNPPVFAMDENEVSILVQPGTVLVTNLDNDDLTLGTNTGMGEFTVYAPLGADDGAPGRIIVGSGTMQVIKNITFGMAPPEMMAPGMPMNVMAMATSDTEIKVTWAAPESDGNSDITGYMVQSAYMMADGMMSDWMDVDPAHMGMDMMYMDMGLMAETKYYYRVAAMNAIDMGDYSDGMAMATTEMTPEPNQAPMAVGMLDAVMLTMGDDPAMVDVSGAFSDADMDDLMYSAMSDNAMVATASAAGSMVTITAVGEGYATVTVTATDPDGDSATQTIMVTVEAAASMELTAPTGVEASDLRNTISVTWTPGSAQNATQIKVVLFNEGVTELVMIHTINPAAGDSGAHTFQNVPAGTYKVTVASYRAGEDHQLSEPFATVTVQ